MRNKRTTEPALELLTTILLVTALILVILFCSRCKKEYITQISTNNYVPQTVTGLKEGGADNLGYFQTLINSVEPRTDLQIPSGQYYFSGTLKIENKSLFITGTRNTNFYFAPGVTGIFINKNNGYMPGKISGINLFAKGENPLFTPKKGHGIEVHALYDLENINIKNFGECGVYTSGGVDNNTNASFNFYSSVFVREVGSHGFYFQGGDANQSVINRCGIWDVGGWGFYDHSFLGNQFFGCMAHASKKGNYRADDPNNRASFFGCYSEGGSPPDYYAGACRIIGAIHGADGDNYELHDWAKAYLD